MHYNLGLRLRALFPSPVFPAGLHLPQQPHRRGAGVHLPARAVRHVRPHLREPGHPQVGHRGRCAVVWLWGLRAFQRAFLCIIFPPICESLGVPSTPHRGRCAATDDVEGWNRSPSQSADMSYLVFSTFFLSFRSSSTFFFRILAPRCVLGRVRGASPRRGREGGKGSGGRRHPCHRRHEAHAGAGTRDAQGVRRDAGARRQRPYPDARRPPRRPRRLGRGRHAHAAVRTRRISPFEPDPPRK